MKKFRVEIKTSMVVNAIDALSAAGEVRYHFFQVCKGAEAVGRELCREASFDVAVIICPKCYSHDCQGSCESQRRVPVIQRNRE